MAPVELSTAAAPNAGGAPVFWDIVEESLEEAEFFWARRDAALDAPDQTLGEVEAQIEERLLGAIDGLCVAGAAGVGRVLAPALDEDEPARIGASSLALLEGGTAEGVALFAATFQAASDAKLLALRRALELSEHGDADALLARAISAAPPSVRAAWLDALSFRGFSPALDFAELFARAGGELPRAAARVLRYAPPAERQRWIARALDLEDHAARREAAETALIMGLPAAWTICRELAAGDLPGTGALLSLVAMLGSARDEDIVLAALAKPARRRDAIWALGFGGRRAGADACVDLLAQGIEPRLAAEAFCAITGLDLTAAGLVVAAPDEPDEPDEPDDVATSSPAPGPDEQLSDPQIPGIIRWWGERRARFDAEVRHIAGRPATFAALHGLLSNGPMRRRHAAALELAVRTEGRFQVQTRAFASRQRRQLGAFSALPREAFAGPFARGMARSAGE